MKKLNKKGFTLVELLAVIVILAVIMVITIPTVLSSMSEATDSAFESAKKAVQKYIDDQLELCNAGLGELAGYENTLFEKQGKSCRIKYVADDTATTENEQADHLAKIVEKAGYKGQMIITVDTETVCVSGAATGSQTSCDYDGVAATGGAAEDGHYEVAFKTVIASATGQGEFAGKN